MTDEPADDGYEIWMTAPAEEALKLQRPLPDGLLAIVMTGEKRRPDALIGSALPQRDKALACLRVFDFKVNDCPLDRILFLSSPHSPQNLAGVALMW
jgi:hypothetical protein